MSDPMSDSGSEVNARDLAALVASISRFLTRLANLAPFREADLGLAEWSALAIIAEKNGITNGQLANVLGVSAQRVNQITDSLRKTGLIALEPSPDDARKKLISITTAGTARLAELNSKLQPAIMAALGKRTDLLGKTNRVMSRTLMRIVLPSAPPAQKSAKIRAAGGAQSMLRRGPAGAI